MPDAGSEGAAAANDVLIWAKQRWRWILVLSLLLLLMWRFAGGKQPEPSGRYVLVKDDVPCQVQSGDQDGRRWCYIVLDTRSGKLEERLRTMGKRKHK